jgi:hypothetical protein
MTAASGIICEIFITVQEYFIAYCICREAAEINIQVPAVSVQTNRDLQQCPELYFSVIDKGARKGFSISRIILGFPSTTKCENP